MNLRILQPLIAAAFLLACFSVPLWGPLWGWLCELVVGGYTLAAGEAVYEATK
jgi:hypothetical protein